MSVDYFLFRTTSEQEELDESESLPFGSQEEIIEQLCSNPGFELRSREPLDEIGPWATITYIYPQKNDNGRDVEFALQGDPVDCISIINSYREDFLLITNIFSHLAPFAILDIDGEVMSSEDLFYSFDEWMQKNYEEEVLSFNYEGY